LLLAKQIITLYHAAQKSIAKDQHALGNVLLFNYFWTGIDIRTMSSCLVVIKLNEFNSPVASSLATW
ncbi:hypothetical protein K1M91_20695, partial [Motilimonas sp. E26]|nr:hypothetical protein [Motilimonas sp. E26]